MTKEWSFVFFAVSVILSVITEDSTVTSSSSSSSPPWLFDSTVTSFSSAPWLFDSSVTPFSPSSSATPFFDMDFYRSSCPDAENIVRSTVTELFSNKSTIAPALIRLLFHDCFIMGCDGSVLLNSTNGTDSERDVTPNQSLKGFDVVEEIKSRLEWLCPGIVSCSDILVLAARDSVNLSGGPFYPLRTGRRDSLTSYPKIALAELPAPTDDLETITQKFSSRHFSPSETVSLLGAHSIGAVHCNFIQDRLHKFNGTNQADPTIERELLSTMIDRCKDPEAFIDLKNEGAPEAGFGTHYFQGLVQNKSVLRSDQEFMNEERTASWVRAYASNKVLFNKDFASAMMKLSDLGVLTGPQFGQVRANCSTVKTDV